MTDADIISRARAVIARSASAPWTAEGRDDATCRGMVVLVDGADQIVGTVNGNDPYEHAFADSDVDAITLARNTLPALLDALEMAMSLRDPDGRMQEPIASALAALREALEAMGR